MLAGCTGYEEEEIPDRSGSGSGRAMRSGSGSGRAMREYPRSTSEKLRFQSGHRAVFACLNFELGKRRFLSNLKMYRPGYRYTDQGTWTDSILQTFGFQGSRCSFSTGLVNCMLWRLNQETSRRGIIKAGAEAGGD